MFFAISFKAAVGISICYQVSGTAMGIECLMHVYKLDFVKVVWILEIWKYLDQINKVKKRYVQKIMDSGSHCDHQSLILVVIVHVKTSCTCQ